MFVNICLLMCSFIILDLSWECKCLVWCIYGCMCCISIHWHRHCYHSSLAFWCWIPGLICWWQWLCFQNCFYCTVLIFAILVYVHAYLDLDCKFMVCVLLTSLACVSLLFLMVCECSPLCKYYVRLMRGFRKTNLIVGGVFGAALSFSDVDQMGHRLFVICLFYFVLRAFPWLATCYLTAVHLKE